MLKKDNGFSLVEMLVVVAIIVILAAVALPIYKKHITENRRSEARVLLQNISAVLDNEKIKTGKYPNITEFNNLNLLTSKYYDISYCHATSACNDIDYRLTAVAKANNQDDSECQNIILEVDGAIENRIPSQCWY